MPCPEAQKYSRLLELLEWASPEPFLGTTVLAPPLRAPQLCFFKHILKSETPSSKIYA